MIKLKHLISLTEQAPVAAKMAPPPAAPEPGADTAAAPLPAADTAPTPEDPSEYDWTRDFRAFEDTKNKQEAAAKKGLVTKMNKFLLNKTITANASRGYGQPKSDYTIESIKKVSVEFWYDKYVVIVTDGNDKKYFLTPGVNIKVDQGAAGGEQPTAPGADQAPTEPPPEQTPPEPEAPVEPKAEEPPVDTPPEGGAPAEPKAAMEPPPEAPKAPAPAPPPAAPTPKAPAPAAPEPEVPVPAPKKKKLPPQPIAEEINERPYNKQYVNRDFGPLFQPFIQKQSKLDLTPCFISGRTSNNGKGWNSTVKFSILAESLVKNFDGREFQLHVKDVSRSSGGPGQSYSRGGVDIQKHGRFYEFTFDKLGGLDI